MPNLKFYDVVAKKSFMTDKYRIVNKRTKRGMVKFAVAKSPHSNIESYRIVARNFKG